MKRQAFTYVELIIALTLFTVGMLSLLQIFPLNRRFLAESSMTTQASFLAEEGIEQARLVPYANLTVGTYQAATAVATRGSLVGFSRQINVYLLDTNWQSTSTDVGLKRVESVVTWDEHGIARTYKVSTLVNAG